MILYSVCLTIVFFCLVTSRTSSHGPIPLVDPLHCRAYLRILNTVLTIVCDAIGIDYPKLITLLKISGATSSIKGDRPYAWSLEGFPGCSRRPESGRDRNSAAITPASCSLPTDVSWCVGVSVAKMWVVRVGLIDGLQAVASEWENRPK